MASIGFDRIKNDEFGSNGNSLYFRSYYTRFSLQAVANLARIMEFEDFLENLGLLIHGGIGFSSNRNGNAPFFGGWNGPDKDNMLNFIIGLTTQYTFDERFSLNIDLSFVNHIYQDRTWDLTESFNQRGFDGFLANASVGISYHLGQHKKHIDWKYNPKPPSMEEITRHIKNELDPEELFAQLPDRDNDGIPDKLDACPDLPGPISTNGCPDRDGDLIPDHKDMCPDDYGLYSVNGCPDRDGDGIPDHIDRCPDIPGLITNYGCPPSDTLITHRGDTVIGFDRIKSYADSIDLSAKSIEYQLAKEIQEFLASDASTDELKELKRILSEGIEKREYKTSSDKKGYDPVEVEADLFDFHELHVVVGMFQVEANAINYVKSLHSQGFPAEIVGKSKGFSIVSVGSFDDINYARYMLYKARKLIIESAWIMKKAT